MCGFCGFTKQNMKLQAEHQARRQADQQAELQADQQADFHADQQAELQADQQADFHADQQAEHTEHNEERYADDVSVLENMMEKIKHRGPNDSTQYIDEYIALGFRRLGIIGPENAGQPLQNEDGRYTLVFNGAIYNYSELKTELSAKGHIFKTTTDSEVLVHLFEDYGSEMLNKLRGMFAIAIWDNEKNMLFIARDYFGIKPLYYHISPEGELVFASEIKSILEYPGFVKKVNIAALESYLSFQYSVMPETFFSGVYRLIPGHYAIYNLESGKIETTRYFEPIFCEDKNLSYNEKIKKIDDVIKDSIKVHTISDTEVGSFLSSGVDSSYVAACFKGNKTFTVAFDYEKYNEAGYAKKLSDTLGISNFCKMISNEDYWDALPKIQYYLDEPLADASCVGLYFASQLASEHVKVVLSGEGADEFFGGYAIYNEPFGLAALMRLPRFVRKILGFMASLIPFDIKGKSFLIRGSKDIEERFIGNAYIFPEKERKKILRQPATAPSPAETVTEYYSRVKDKDDTTKMQYVDIHTWLAGDILLKADRMSMAHSLELRAPFLDKEVFKVAAALSLKDKVDGKHTKIILRQAASLNIPAESAGRKKLGFPTPIRIWLKEEPYFSIVKKAFESEAAGEFFNTKAICSMLEIHRSGKRDLSRKIWTVYMFLVWHSVFFDQEGKQG